MANRGSDLTQVGSDFFLESIRFSNGKSKTRITRNIAIRLEISRPQTCTKNIFFSSEQSEVVSQNTGLSRVFRLMQNARELEVTIITLFFNFTRRISMFFSGTPPLANWSQAICSRSICSEESASRTDFRGSSPCPRSPHSQLQLISECFAAAGWQ